jgi:hypothetical protein
MISDILNLLTAIYQSLVILLKKLKEEENLKKKNSARFLLLRKLQHQVQTRSCA